VKNAWVRPTVAGQKSSGAFMTITAREPMRLVRVSSPLAGVAEVHEMKMDGDVMRMRAMPRIDLPAGQDVQFRPGGYHVMLMDLTQPLVVGGALPLTLWLENASGVASRIELKLPVMARAPAGPAAALDRPVGGSAKPEQPARP
jgi:periplasmic copper chaperone A